MQQIYFLSILDLHASCSKLARILQQKRLERYIIRTMFDNVMKINFMVLQVEMNRFYYLMPKSKPEVKYQNKLKKIYKHFLLNIFQVSVCFVYYKLQYFSKSIHYCVCDTVHVTVVKHSNFSISHHYQNLKIQNKTKTITWEDDIILCIHLINFNVIHVVKYIILSKFIISVNFRERTIQNNVKSTLHWNRSTLFLEF